MTRAAVTIAAALLLTGQAWAQQPFNPPPRTFDPAGFEVFLGVLHVHNFAATQDFSRPPDVLIVLHPPRPPAVPGEFQFEPRAELLSRAVLQRGGSVLIAADGGADLSNYFPGTNVTVRAGSATNPTGRVWDGNARCPLAVPIPPVADVVLGRLGGAPADPVMRLFDGLSRVATNAPSALRFGPLRADLPRNVALLPDETTDLVTGRSLGNGLLAAGGTGPRGGRALVVADPGVFSNQMLTAVDAAGAPSDNLALSDAVARWLANGQDKRTCLVVVNGNPAPASSFTAANLSATPPLPPVPLPSLDPFDPATVKLDQALTGAAEDAVANLESADGGLDRLAGANDDTGDKFARVGRAALAALAVTAAILTLRRVWRARHRPAADDDVPLPAPAADRADPTEAVREYVRDLLRAAGAADFTTGVPALAGPRAKTLRPSVRILWDVAGGRDRRPVTPARWRELAAHVQAAQDGLAAGAWQFRTQSTTR